MSENDPLYQRLLKMKQEAEARARAAAQGSGNGTPDPSAPPAVPREDDPGQCECGSHLKGDCPDCDQPGGVLPVQERLKKLGDEHQVNPPKPGTGKIVDLPDGVDYREAGKKVGETLANGLNKALGTPQDAQEPPQVPPVASKPLAPGKPKKKALAEKAAKAVHVCPICGLSFKRLALHKCKPKDVQQVWETVQTAMSAAQEQAQAMAQAPAPDPERIQAMMDAKPEEMPQAMAIQALEGLFRKELARMEGEIKSRLDAAMVDTSCKLEASVQEPNPVPEIDEINLLVVFDGAVIYPNFVKWTRSCRVYFRTWTLEEILTPLAECVAQENQVAHWSCVEFGKGPGMLAAKFETWIQENRPVGIILADSSTAETRAVKSVLRNHATMIIQGVR